MITVFLNIQFFWDVTLCRWVRSSPDTAKDCRMCIFGLSSPKTASTGRKDVLYRHWQVVTKGKVQVASQKGRHCYVRNIV